MPDRLGLIFDGYDLVVYGTVVSTFLRDPSHLGEVTPETAGALGSYALIGVLVGALLAGSVGDIIGRRKVMLTAYAWFAIGMGVTALTNSTTTFGLMRFFTGLGVGALVATTGVEVQNIHEELIHRMMALSTATVAIWPLRTAVGLSRELAALPVPQLAREPGPDEGPVVVILSYTVEADQVPEFLDVMERLRRSRLRTGATSCDLYQDGMDPSLFVQVSRYATWAEHLRHHTGRLTGADLALYEEATALATGPPEVKHLLAPPQ